MYGKVEWNIFRVGIDQIKLNFVDENERLLDKQHLSIENRIHSEVAELYAEMQFVAESIDLKEHSLKVNYSPLKGGACRKNRKLLG